MATLEINDAVYGMQVISEPALLDLLASPAVQRLKGIHQAGASYLVRSGRDVSRFEHVVGAMILIRICGGSVEEQAAGLIHDVSHTAYSHVADQVFRRRNEDYHELHFQRLVFDSNIPMILSNQRIAPASIFDVERWRLLEQPLPDLCADRIDYTLRDLVRIGTIDRADCACFVRALRVLDGCIVVAGIDEAIWFVERYADVVQGLYMNPLELYANDQMAKAIRTALDHGALSEDDLFGQDDDVLAKLHAAKDPEISSILEGLTPDVQVVEDSCTYDLHVYSKARIVDPLVMLQPDHVVRCSEVSPAIVQVHAQVMRKANAGIFVRRVLPRA